MTLTLLLIIIPVVGSIIGLFSKAWDDTKKSRIKLTTRGWLSLSIITIGFCLTIVKTIETQNENIQLKEQRNKVRSFVYNKLYTDCVSEIQPLIDIYLRNRHPVPYDLNNNYELCLKLLSDSGQQSFKDLDLLEKVKFGTAFESWDKSYAAYLNGYFQYPAYTHLLDQTVTKWSSYIDSEDLVLLDTITTDDYFKKIISVTNEYVKPKGLVNQKRKVGQLMLFDSDDDYLKEQNDLISHIVKLLKKSKEYINN